MKRLFCVILALIVCMGMLAGCAKKPTPLPPMEEIPRRIGPDPYLHSEEDPIPSKKLTQETFELLVNDMTLETVEMILGKGQWTEACKRYDGTLEVYYEWAGLNGERLKLEFWGDRLQSVTSFQGLTVDSLSLIR